LVNIQDEQSLERVAAQSSNYMGVHFAELCSVNKLLTIGIGDFSLG